MSATTREPWLDRRPVARCRIENVTHALAGILAAHLLVDVAARRSDAPAETWQRTRRVAVITSAVANNVPDTDLVYSWITKGPLGYLMHHRGHTHTLPVAIALGVLAALVIVRIARRAVGGAPLHAERLVLLLGALGPVLHLGMDAWNIYGVHPFWPFDDRWFYGDRIFILEPLFWVTALPLAFVRSRSRFFRGFVGCLMALIMVVPWLAPSFVPRPISAALMALAVLSCGWAWKRSAHSSLRFAIAAWVLVLGMFSLARQRAEQLVTFALYEEMPSVVVEDIALTPLPSNPLCFSTIVTAIPDAKGDRFILRRGSVDVFGIGAFCPKQTEVGTAPLREVAARPPVEWTGELSLSRAELRELATRCDVAAAMRFYRAPFWVRDGDALTFGDLRFDRSPGADFPEVTMPSEAPAADACPRFIPSWEPPRARMLEPP